LKDQYVGDINDYAKYLLLRLASPSFDPVVVAWMLTGGDQRGDGGRIQYLSQPRWRSEDPELFDALRLLVTGNRCVAEVQRAGFLEDCVFAAQPIDGDAQGRSRYFSSLERLAGPDSLVFFDPDNGMEVPSVPRHRRGAERYLFWEELSPFGEIGASVMIYQHFPRVNRKAYLDLLLPRLSKKMGDEYTVFAVHSSQVAFLFALRGERVDPLQGKIARHCAGSRLMSLHLRG